MRLYSYIDGTLLFGSSTPALLFILFKFICTAPCRAVQHLPVAVRFLLAWLQMDICRMLIRRGCMSRIRESSAPCRCHCAGVVRGIHRRRLTRRSCVSRRRMGTVAAECNPPQPLLFCAQKKKKELAVEGNFR